MLRRSFFFWRHGGAKHCSYLPPSVKIFIYSSNVSLVLLPFFLLILGQQRVGGDGDHADALREQVRTSARQHDVGGLTFSMAANMQEEVKKGKRVSLITNTDLFIAHTQKKLYATRNIHEEDPDHCLSKHQTAPFPSLPVPVTRGWRCSSLKTLHHWRVSFRPWWWRPAPPLHRRLASLRALQSKVRHTCSQWPAPFTEKLNETKQQQTERVREWQVGVVITFLTLCGRELPAASLKFHMVVTK